MIRREWKLTDPEAQRVMKENCAVYDRMRVLLRRSCPVPDCGYMLSSIPEEQCGIPGYGDVCGVCFHMYYALQGAGMRSPFYFRMIHDKWLKEQKGGKSPWENLG